MSDISYPFTHPFRLRLEASFVSLQTNLLRIHAAWKNWQQQRQVLRDLESMPPAMRKDLGWPAIDAQQERRNARR